MNYGEFSDGQQEHASQVGFCCRRYCSPRYRLCIYARGRVAQIVSDRSNFTQEERLSVAKPMLSTGKGGKIAIVIGVQTKGSDVASSVGGQGAQYPITERGKKNGRDALTRT